MCKKIWCKFSRFPCRRKIRFRCAVSRLSVNPTSDIKVFHSYQKSDTKIIKNVLHWFVNWKFQPAWFSERECWLSYPEHATSGLFTNSFSTHEKIGAIILIIDDRGQINELHTTMEYSSRRYLVFVLRFGYEFIVRCHDVRSKIKLLSLPDGLKYLLPKFYFVHSLQTSTIKKSLLFNIYR